MNYKRACVVFLSELCVAVSQSERKQPFHCLVTFYLPTLSLNQILKEALK